jgi:hypothetical protein
MMTHDDEAPPCMRWRGLADSTVPAPPIARWPALPNPVTRDVDRADGPVSRTSGALRKASELVHAAGDVRDF